MKNYIILLLVVLFLFSTGIAFSQQPKFNKVLDGTKYGFGPVFSIVQDQRGFIWFTSAQKGLQRYDGKKLTTYSHNSDNPNSLASNMTSVVSVDSTGNIWIGTFGSGLDRFDPETKIFTHFRHDPRDPASLGNDTIFAITTDRSGIIWIGTNRTLDQFNPTTGKFTHYIIDELFNYVNNSDNFFTINAIFEDRNGALWIGWGEPFAGKKDGHGGLARFDKTTGKFIIFKHDPANPNSLSDNNVFDIYEDSKNNLWVCTRGSGLQTLDRATGKFTHYGYYDPAYPERLSRPPFTGSEFDFVSFITEDAKGRLWTGSTTGGLNMYDPLLKTTIHYGLVSNDITNRFAEDTLSGFKDSTAIRAFSSKDGLLWISAGFNGNLYNVDFSGTTIPFVSLNAKASAFYYEEDKNILWIQSDSALIRKNLLNSQQKLFKPDSRSYNDQVISNVMDMKGDGEGNIWMATHFNGLLKFNIKTEQFSNIRHDKNNPASLLDDATHALFFDRQQYLWIGTHTGVSRMDTKTGSYTNYINNPKDSLSIGAGHINSFAQDKNGTIWIGTNVDMYAFDTKTEKFKRYALGGQITTICIDETGKIWAAGAAGLYFLDKQKNIFKKFTTQVFPEGIESVSGMVVDTKENIWLSTGKGIIKINKEQDAEKIFGLAQGVEPLADLWYKNISTKDGRLFLGGKKGYYSFKPDELIDERTAPLLNFTNFKIGSQEIVVEDGTVLTVPIWETNSLKLSYSQNTISFEFDAIDYRSLGEIKYLYKLENYDNEWRDIGIEHKATFFNLPHGKYILQIKAINDVGSVAQKSMAIIITPPWWKTWWAYCIYGLLLIVLVYGIDRFQRQRLLKDEKERNRERELAQAKEIEKAYLELGKAHETLKSTQSQLIQSEKMASLGELTAGIAHEIQNPLNFVNNFAEVNVELIAELKQELEKGDITEAIAIADDIAINEEKILEHGKRADSIVKGMLQHSRSSSGIKEPTDLNALADEYLRLSYHGLRAKDKTLNADFKTEFDVSLPEINIIPQDIGRVLLNLINNAFYAVAEKQRNLTELDNYVPTVIISTKNLGESIEISVKDNGNGIPEEIKNKIFQPFFTTKPTGQGTGLGLSLSYDIVVAHSGELKVESLKGVGSEFIIRLKTL